MLQVRSGAETFTTLETFLGNGGGESPGSIVTECFAGWGPDPTFVCGHFGGYCSHNYANLAIGFPVYLFTGNQK